MRRKTTSLTCLGRVVREKDRIGKTQKKQVKKKLSEKKIVESRMIRKKGNEKERKEMDEREKEIDLFSKRRREKQRNMTSSFMN